MTIDEVLKAAEKAADEWWNKKSENSLCSSKTEFYTEMMKDLRAIGRTDEEIWQEFMTEVFIYGFCQAHKDVFEKEKK